MTQVIVYKNRSALTAEKYLEISFMVANFLISSSKVFSQFKSMLQRLVSGLVSRIIAGSAIQAVGLIKSLIDAVLTSDLRDRSVLVKSL